jgi:Ca-activated chloride channel family protein
MSVDADLRAAVPEAPYPDAAARDAAIAAALARFDRKAVEKTSQGFPRRSRQRVQGGRRPPEAGTTGMRRKTAYGIAAALALVAAPFVLLEPRYGSSGLDNVQMSSSMADGPAPTHGGSSSTDAAIGDRGNGSAYKVRDFGKFAAGVRDLFVDGREPSRSAKVAAAPPAPPSNSTIQGGRPSPSPEMSRELARADAERIRMAQAQAAAPTIETRQAIAPPGDRGLGGNATARMAPLPGAAPSAYIGIAPPYEPAPPPAEPAGRDSFEARPGNPFRQAKAEPVSTFSLDVDTASYGFARAALARNALPQRDSIRTEEFLNYFPYAYPAPDKGGDAFRATVSVMPSPWNAGRKLVHVGIKAYAVPASERPKANLVFLVDTSGSMSPPNRLPLAKQALSLLLGELKAGDTVAIVAYAGSAGTVLEPTDATDRPRIQAAIDRLGAGGSTAGAEGIRQAYALAERNFDPKAVNRIMLATDGDFNVGISNPNELKSFVEAKRASGIYLSVLGFGMGNYRDTTMQALAQNGNGTAAYVDGIAEARKVLVQEAGSSVLPVADDAKAQVEFNPRTVAEYRLVGYEKRLLRREDFNNDRVDAGEIGSGHTVTALYEIVPVGAAPTVTPLRYGEEAREAPAAAVPEGAAGEYGFLQLRYKRPGASESTLMTQPFGPGGESARFDAAPAEARFAVAAAGFAELLKGSPHVGALRWDDVIAAGLSARGDDPFGYRSEFVQLVRTAKALSEGAGRR